MSKVILFLNGRKLSNLPDLSVYDKIYCTDGAYDFLKKKGVEPNFVVGDMDSISHTSNNKKYILAEDQSLTDFEKTIKIILKNGHKKVDVFFASGNEQDHFLGNLSVGAKYFSDIQINFYDEYHRYLFSDDKLNLSNVINKKISIYPFPKTNITTKGLEYEVSDYDLCLAGKIGIRNKALEDNISVSVNSGLALFFVEK